MREKKNQGLENDVFKTYIRRSCQDVFQYIPAEPFKDVRIWTSFERFFLVHVPTGPGNQQILKQTTTIKNTRRPPVVTNNFPEHNNPAWRNHKPTVPGNAKYSNAVRFGRKTVILGTSMIKGIRMKEFNGYVKNGYLKLRPFSGATV